jgi:hypothetical protein
MRRRRTEDAHPPTVVGEVIGCVCHGSRDKVDARDRQSGRSSSGIVHRSGAGSVGCRVGGKRRRAGKGGRRRLARCGVDDAHRATGAPAGAVAQHVGACTAELGVAAGAYEPYRMRGSHVPICAGTVQEGARRPVAQRACSEQRPLTAMVGDDPAGTRRSTPRVPNEYSARSGAATGGADGP